MKVIKDKEIIKKYLNDADYRKLFPKQIDKYGRLVIFDSMETILYQGQDSEYLYYLFKGKCKVLAYMENGKAIVIKNAEAPCLIGEIELFNEDSSFSVETLSECTAIMFPLEECKQILLNDQKFLLENCRILAKKERNTAFELSRNMSFPLINRLARFILDNSVNNVMNIKKTMIAESLGVSYRHLEKVMND